MEEVIPTGRNRIKIRNYLVFAVNGLRCELLTVDPSTTLLEFLRSQTQFKSVKLSCGEGGCGACLVLLSKYDPITDRVKDFTINSCLTLLCSINGCSITTSEGLGNKKDGFHSIHNRFAGFHASQCGFCTPGMCISLFGALVNAEKTDQEKPPPGFSNLTVLEAEKAVLGNLCRCTGYRPIADACKSFAADVDMEDLGLNSFWKKEASREVKARNLPLYESNTKIHTFPEFLKREIKISSFLDSERFNWFRPSRIEELRSVCGDGARTKLVVGNTGMGYYKELDQYDRYVDLTSISELSVITKDQSGIEFGATVTISEAIEALKEENKGEFPSEFNMVLHKIALHMEKVGSEFIRNSASIGGNIVMAQKNGFPSDIVTVLLAVSSMVNIVTRTAREKLTLEEFLEWPPLDSGTVLLSVKIPILKEINCKVLFETYRASPRLLGNALAYLNAAFFAEFDGVVLNKCQLAFGSYGTKHSIRARKIEEFLTGKSLTIDVLFEAIRLVKDTVVPEDGTRNSEYRLSLAVGYLFHFFSPLVNFNGLSNGFIETSLSKVVELKQNNDRLDCFKPQTLLSPSKQEVQMNTEFHPVGQAVTKSNAALQASGEAVYVDDIPSPVNCLHGAFIYSKKALARVKGIEFDSKLPPDRVAAVISVKDIPEGGQNIGAKTIFGPEPLFADDLTQSAGQRIALVVADTQKQADAACEFAVVDYEMENVEHPILTVEEAVKRSSFFEVPPFLYPKEVGDILEGMAAADDKILSAQIKLGSQYYFYMETQSALAVPDEDNCIVVYSSTQCPEFAHAVIASCLGVPEHNVRVITRRVGGGFGGKAIKSMPVATACALAAHKLQRPVRMYLNRKTDMIMAGGRHPMKVTYSVGFKSNGKITALKLDILIDAGMTSDISPVIPHNLMGPLKKYDWGALSFNIKVCKTNLPSRSAMRAPGEVQGSFIAEAIIERVASSLSIDADSVRLLNLHSFDSLNRFYDSSGIGEPVEYTLASIWEKLGVYMERKDMISEFNRFNLWSKRGISRIPIIHSVVLRPTPGRVSILSDGSVVVEVGGIELGQGLWTKVKQMAAFSLGSIECDGAKELLDKVRVVQSDTLSLIQGGFTSGSTTSESSCEAVRICCKTLVDRLSALKGRLQKQMGSVNWEILIRQAYLEAVNLSASSFFVPDFASMSYLNYGAAMSEVEINLLTGQTTILRSDIIYDCGQSLNPAVDLGQIEGAFVQGIGFFMLEEYTTNADGLVDTEGTWTYKIPTIDTIPKQLNVEILNSGHHQNRVLSSKASGEPPLLLAASVHCATRAAIREAREQVRSWGFRDGFDSNFVLEVPATMPVVKELCGLDNVERYLQWKMGSK